VLPYEAESAPTPAEQAIEVQQLAVVLTPGDIDVEAELHALGLVEEASLTALKVEFANFQVSASEVSLEEAKSQAAPMDSTTARLSMERATTIQTARLGNGTAVDNGTAVEVSVNSAARMACLACLFFGGLLSMMLMF